MFLVFPKRAAPILGAWEIFGPPRNIAMSQILRYICLLFFHITENGTIYMKVRCRWATAFFTRNHNSAPRLTSLTQETGILIHLARSVSKPKITHLTSFGVRTDAVIRSLECQKRTRSYKPKTRNLSSYSFVRFQMAKSAWSYAQRRRRKSMRYANKIEGVPNGTMSCNVA